MNLDDISRFEELDPAGMLAEIDRLPDQLESAWKLGWKLPLGEISGVRKVLIAGMGGSAIAADLLAAYAAPMATVPIIVWRDYDLPAFCADHDVLVIVCSHSGNTEETLSAFTAGVESETQLLAMTTGGELTQQANANGVPLWHFDHMGQPRAAVGYSFGLLLALMTRLGLIPDPEGELSAAVREMRSQQKALRAESPIVENPAKRMAGQLVGRWPTIMGAEFLAPVARRWRTQIGELAKAVAGFEALPEADHNMVAGVLHPESHIPSSIVVFLQGSQVHERNILRTQVTREILMLEGFGTDVIEARGDTRLSQQWTMLHFGDYTSYYLAMAYGVDPTPVDAIEDLKSRLRMK